MDHAFMAHLATGTPILEQVSNFLEDRRCQGVANDYADALGAYVRGVLVKDQASGSGVTLPPGEAIKLYGQALEGMRSFLRPLSSVICALVRFSFNDFSFADVPCGYFRLDKCNKRLASLLIGGGPGNGYASQSKDRATLPLCPVDQATDRVLDMASRLERQSHWGPTILEDCRQTAKAETISPEDRVKVDALWAASAMEHGDDDAAIEPLRRLRPNLLFGDWATNHLDRMGE